MGAASCETRLRRSTTSRSPRRLRSREAPNATATPRWTPKKTGHGRPARPTRPASRPPGSGFDLPLAAHFQRGAKRIFAYEPSRKRSNGQPTPADRTDPKAAAPTPLPRAYLPEISALILIALMFGATSKMSLWKMWPPMNVPPTPSSLPLPS